jgi:hypothetical protein
MMPLNSDNSAEIRIHSEAFIAILPHHCRSKADPPSNIVQKLLLYVVLGNVES